MTTIAYPTINVEATGARIKKLRKEKGIKVAELSEFMGFSEPQAVYKWQRGETLPSVDNLFALSRILETSIEDILVGDDEVSSFFMLGNISLIDTKTELQGYLPFLHFFNMINRQ